MKMPVNPWAAGSVKLLCVLTLFGNSCLSPGLKPVETPAIEYEDKGEDESVVFPTEPPPYITKDIDGISFEPGEITSLFVPPEAGVISERDAENPDAGGISGLFTDAYRQALIREIPLKGVLSMDRVHRWPENESLTWAQNWVSDDARPNSWGIPGLVLAVLNVKTGKVFTVRDGILDMYGKSLGLDGANGVMGYGSPLSDVFFMELPDYSSPIYAQRFDNGVIYVDETGKSAFIPGKAPSTSIDDDEMTGFYSTDDAELRGKIKKSFKRAYNNLALRYEGAIKASGPVEYLDFDGNTWTIEAGESVLSLTGVYVQYYNEGVFAAALPDFSTGDGGDADAFPFFGEARIIGPPFSQVIFGGIRLPSAEDLALYPLEEYAYISPLLKGFALYGIPLTDSFVSVETGMSVQRFSRGVFRSTIVY
jgi:hypothetical protein